MGTQGAQWPEWSPQTSSVVQSRPRGTPMRQRSLERLQRTGSGFGLARRGSNGTTSSLDTTQSSRTNRAAMPVATFSMKIEDESDTQSRASSSRKQSKDGKHGHLHGHAQGRRHGHGHGRSAQETESRPSTGNAPGKKHLSPWDAIGGEKRRRNRRRRDRAVQDAQHPQHEGGHDTESALLSLTARLRERERRKLAVQEEEVDDEEAFRALPNDLQHLYTFDERSHLSTGLDDEDEFDMRESSAQSDGRNLHRSKAEQQARHFIAKTAALRCVNVQRVNHMVARPAPEPDEELQMILEKARAKPSTSTLSPGRPVVGGDKNGDDGDGEEEENEETRGRRGDAEVRAWIQQRQGVRSTMGGMALDEEWLAKKQRCPAEDRIYHQLLASKSGEHGSADVRADPSGSPHNTGGTTTARDPSGRSPSSLNKTHALSHQRADHSSTHHPQLHNPPKQGHLIPVSSEQRQVSFSGVGVTFQEAAAAIEAFADQNQWRLHDLFSRLKEAPEDYRLSVETICSYLELAGGLRPAGSDERVFLVMLQSNKFQGSLRGITPAHLKRFVCQCGMDAEGKVDYRVIVDNHRRLLEMEQRLRQDKIRRKRNGLPPRSSKELHTLIAESVQQGDPLKWLSEEEEKEARARAALMRRVAGDGIGAPTFQQKQQQMEVPERMAGIAAEIDRPLYAGEIPTHLQWNWQGIRRWNSLSNTFDTFHERMYPPGKMAARPWEVEHGEEAGDGDAAGSGGGRGDGRLPLISGIGSHTRGLGEGEGKDRASSTSPRGLAANWSHRQLTAGHSTSSLDPLQRSLY